MVNIFNFRIKFYNLNQNIPSLTGNFWNKNDIYKIQTYWNYQEFKEFINIYKTLFETLFFTGLRLGKTLILIIIVYIYQKLSLKNFIMVKEL